MKSNHTRIQKYRNVHTQMVKMHENDLAIQQRQHICCTARISSSPRPFHNNTTEKSHPWKKTKRKRLIVRECLAGTSFDIAFERVFGRWTSEMRSVELKTFARSQHLHISITPLSKNWAISQWFVRVQKKYVPFWVICEDTAKNHWIERDVRYGAYERPRIYAMWSGI